MTELIGRASLAPRYWETTPLSEMSQAEWEALCDGCGKCCLNKLEDEDGVVELTCVSCKLLDTATGRCSNYHKRRDFVPECIQLNVESIAAHLYWLPKTCAYRLLYQGEPLPAWHPLVSGCESSVQQAGVSVAGRAVSEDDVNEDDWDRYIIEEPM